MFAKFIKHVLTSSRRMEDREYQCQAKKVATCVLQQCLTIYDISRTLHHQMRSGFFLQKVENGWAIIIGAALLELRGWSS